MLGPANGDSSEASISGDGRYVAFSSTASNLVAADTNGQRDDFVRDMWSGTTWRVSIGAHGRQANGWSDWPALSADGRFVVFFSTASNLARGDDNGVGDVFVRDLRHRKTRRVSVGAHNEQGNRPSWGASISGDGRYVAFLSDATNLVPCDTNSQTDLFVRDLRTHTTRLVDQGRDHVQANGGVSGASIAASGHFVAYTSHASNLVAGDTNRIADIFLTDLGRGSTQRVNLAPDGAQSGAPAWGPLVSADGRYVTFTAQVDVSAGAEVPIAGVLIRDLLLGTTTLIAE